MIKIYATYRNEDMTEGRGPMVIDKIFTKRKDAEDYIDNQSGVMGRKKIWSKEKYGDWIVNELVLFESLDELKKQKEIELINKFKTSYTQEEIEILKKNFKFL
jgi:hypothetical protein